MWLEKKDKVIQKAQYQRTESRAIQCFNSIHKVWAIWPRCWPRRPQWSPRNFTKTTPVPWSTGKVWWARVGRRARGERARARVKGTCGRLLALLETGECCFLYWFWVLFFHFYTFDFKFFLFSLFLSLESLWSIFYWVDLIFLFYF